MAPAAGTSPSGIPAARRRFIKSGLLAAVLALAVLCLAAVLVWAVKQKPAKPWNPGLAFSVSAIRITRGQQIVLRWSATGADSLQLDGVPVPNSGSRADSPMKPATYRLVAFGPGAKSESREVTVQVIEPMAPAAIRFTGSRDHIVRGQSLSLQWSVTGATRVEIEPDIGPVDAEGTHSVSPKQPTEYTLTADGPGGGVADHFKVRVDAPLVNKIEAAVNQSPRPQELPGIELFQAAPAASIQQCEKVLLRWTVHGASRISIEPGLGEIASEPTYRIVGPLLKTTTYTLKAEGPGGPVTRDVTVIVAHGNRSSCAQ